MKSGALLKPKISSPKLKPPAVAVVMAVYNGEDYVQEAIQSVLDQTFQDFEFIIVNDASTDQTAALIDSFEDPRIRLIENCKNIGLTRSLNKGIEHTAAEFIARLDADDLALKERLQEQVRFFKKHPETDLLITGFLSLNEQTQQLHTVCPDKDPDLLRWQLLFANKVRHSTVMFRRSTFLKIGKYDETFELAQDYDLWSRMTEKARVAVLPDPLTKMHEPLNSLSLQKTEIQRAAMSEISRENIKTLTDRKWNDLDCRLIHEFLGRGRLPERPFQEKAFLLIEELLILFELKFQKTNKRIRRKIRKECVLRLLNNLQPQYSIKERLPLIRFLFHVDPIITLDELLRKLCLRIFSKKKRPSK